MGLLNLLLKNPLGFVIIAVPLLYAVIFHELAHGWVAYRMGDPTAKSLGRLSLNPLKHLDPMGTMMLFLVGFGWAKPVPVNFNLLRDKRLGMILVSAAGIITNMLLAFCALFLYQLLSLPSSSVPAQLLYYFARINIILAAFNLIPLPPLDGSKILMGFASPGVRNSLLRIERFGFLIIIGLLFLGVLTPVIRFFERMILSVIALLLP
jgi:Zn-dependent protease